MEIGYRLDLDKTMFLEVNPLATFSVCRLHCWNSFINYFVWFRNMILSWGGRTWVTNI